MRRMSEESPSSARRPMRLLVAVLALSCPLGTRPRAVEPPARTLEQREEEATSDEAVFLLVAETFASFPDARAHVEKVRAASGLDLKVTFGSYGYEVTSARMFSVVGEIESRLRTVGASPLARWVNPKLCFDGEAKARTAAKKLALVERGFDELARCHWVVWSKPVPRDRVREVTRKVAAAGYEEQLFLEVADVVIVLGKALTPPERTRIEAIAREHGIKVQILKTSLFQGD